mmetsp:Transcript_15770/g.52774  ORF Transcript_15770/g.52774 Transcript_15770/m.52774 type:complete len:84 (+) Transcript_15770:2684-2935(+)
MMVTCLKRTRKAATIRAARKTSSAAHLTFNLGANACNQIRHAASAATSLFALTVSSVERSSRPNVEAFTSISIMFFVDYSFEV